MEGGLVPVPMGGGIFLGKLVQRPFDFLHAVFLIEAVEEQQVGRNDHDIKTTKENDGQ
ncbi:hypothetical protein D3C73_1564670 [compost metagenome]